MAFDETVHSVPCCLTWFRFYVIISSDYTGE